MSASRSAANSPLRCSSHRSAASPSSPDDRQLARARLFLRRKRRTPTGPSSAPSPQQIALNDPLEASRAATAASLSSDRFRHRESISSCLPFSTVTQPALVLFPNQIRIYSQQAPRILCIQQAFRDFPCLGQVDPGDLRRPVSWYFQFACLFFLKLGIQDHQRGTHRRRDGFVVCAL